MQKTNWLQYGLIGFAAIIGGASTMVACGGDDDDDTGNDGGVTSSSSGGTSGVTSSSGASGDGGTTSSGGSSGASSSSGGPAPVPAALAVVHSYPGIGPVRICYAISPTAIPELNTGLSAIAPLPDTAAGLLPGSGGILPSTGLVLSDYNIRPYLIKSDKIPAGAQCPEVIGDLATQDPALVEGTDYFALAPIPKGTLANEKTFVLIAREDPANAGKATAVFYELDTTTAVAADKIGVQFIHATDDLSKVFAQENVAPFIDRPTGGDAGILDGDAGTRVNEYLLGATNTSKVAPFGAISATKVTDPFVTVVDTAFGVAIGDTNVEALNRKPIQAGGGIIPIATWSALSDPGKTQGDGAASLYFQSGNAFTFIAVGDPTKQPPAQVTTPEEAAAAYLAPHFLVFPNKPLQPAL